MASVLTSVTDQETSYGTVAMHDGPMSGELRHNEVNVHSVVICPIGFSRRRSILQVTHFFDDFIFVGPAKEPITMMFAFPSFFRVDIGWSGYCI